jgi:hypothetical protein
MAVAIPGTFLKSVLPLRAREDAVVRPFRLSSNHLADLRDVARGVEESNVGIACKYLIDHTLVGGNADIDPDGYVNQLDAVERFCDQFGVWQHPTVATWRKRIARCRRALTKLHDMGEHKAVAVLHTVYGHPDPLVRTFAKRVQEVLGELAPLARYTDIVEVKRQEMARTEAVRLDERASQRKETGGKKKDETREIAERQELRAIAIRHGYPANVGTHLRLELRRREYYQWALASISSVDALQAQLSVPTEREYGETKEQFQDRRDVAENRRDMFIVQVKLEAEKMLTSASAQYHGAWLSVR